LNSAEQVVFVLQIILTLGPLAVYFLALGLVNSQASSRLVNARVDFVLLTIAFVPVILVPAVLLVWQGWLLTAIGGLLAVGGLFRAMLPARSGAWVIYNIDAHECRQLLKRACRRLGWTASCTQDELHVCPVGLTVRWETLPWLRNATIRVHAVSDDPLEPAQARLIGAIREEIEQLAMLPSPTGASLVLIGAGLLGMPLWYVFQHIEAIVDVVQQILFA
jgi:hypothetical protein